MMESALVVDSAQSFTRFVAECQRHIRKSTGGRMLASQLLDSMAAWIENGDFAPQALTRERLGNPWTSAAMLIAAGIEYD